MHFYKWLERTYPTNGKTIHANSFEKAVAGLKAEIRDIAEAKFASQFSYNVAFAA